MSTLVREEIPLRLSPCHFYLIEPHQFECRDGEIRWILVVSSLEGFGSRVFIPLLAGNLTASASSTLYCIYEKGFIRHLRHLL
jgi:hypothetical protein